MEGPPAKRALYKESEKGKAQQGAKASSANPASQRNEPAESAVSSSSKGADAHSKDKAVNPGTLEREDSFPMLNSQVHFGQDYVVQRQDSSQSSSQAADLREIRRRGGIVPADEDHAHDAHRRADADDYDIPLTAGMYTNWASGSPDAVRPTACLCTIAMRKSPRETAC